jgi:hypothetical protein
LEGSTTNSQQTWPHRRGCPLFRSVAPSNGPNREPCLALPGPATGTSIEETKEATAKSKQSTGKRHPVEFQPEIPVHEHIDFSDFSDVLFFQYLYLLHIGRCIMEDLSMSFHAVLQCGGDAPLLEPQ